MSKLPYLGHWHPVDRVGTQARDQGLTDPGAEVDEGLEPADGLAPERETERETETEWAP